MKEKKPKGLLRLFDGLTDETGRPNPRRYEARPSR